MILQLNNMRNKANGINAKHTIINDDKFGIRFRFNDIIIDKRLFSGDKTGVQNMEQQMKDILIEESLDAAFENHWKYKVGFEHAHERIAATVYTALLELNDEELA